MNNINTNPHLKILGINDDADFCAVCGKTHLKRVVWIQDMNGAGGIIHVGTTCATKQYGYLFGKNVEGAALKAQKENINTLKDFIESLIESSDDYKAKETAQDAVGPKDPANFVARHKAGEPFLDRINSQRESYFQETGLNPTGTQVIDFDKFSYALASI
jgi:tRNA U38,U39,U40 pseudouridine synthase TruA